MESRSKEAPATRCQYVPPVLILGHPKLTDLQMGRIAASDKMPRSKFGEIIFFLKYGTHAELLTSLPCQFGRQSD